MIERKDNTYRFYPTPEQVAQMAQIVGSCHLVYNLALEQRSEWYRLGRIFNFFSQYREIAELHSEIDWIKAAPFHTLKQALKNLGNKGLNNSFRFPDSNSIEVEHTKKSSGQIKLPQLGWVRFRDWYVIFDAIRSCGASV